METIDFAKVKDEILDRLNNQRQLVTEDNEAKLESESPLSIVNGNFFQVK